MGSEVSRTVRRKSAVEVPVQTMFVGKFVDVVDGRPLVCVGGESETRFARVAESTLGATALAAGATVVLLHDPLQADSPVIVARVAERVTARTAARTAQVAHVDGKQVLNEGQQEVELRCGSASIVLRASGEIVIKGTELTSRASATNKIRGASVQIN